MHPWRISFAELRIVDRAAVALLASGFLHALQTFFLIFQLGSRAFYILLLLLLAFVPLHTTSDAVAGGKLN